MANFIRKSWALFRTSPASRFRGKKNQSRTIDFCLLSALVSSAVCNLVQVGEGRFGAYRLSFIWMVANKKRFKTLDRFKSTKTIFDFDQKWSDGLFIWDMIISAQVTVRGTAPRKGVKRLRNAGRRAKLIKTVSRSPLEIVEVEKPPLHCSQAGHRSVLINLIRQFVKKRTPVKRSALIATNCRLPWSIVPGGRCLRLSISSISSGPVSSVSSQRSPFQNRNLSPKKKTINDDRQQTPNDAPCDRQKPC